jgi:Uma2 family endonuclease
MPATAPMPAATPPAQKPAGRYANMREFHDALGGIPMERIVFNPWPGSATEADCVEYSERIRTAELINGTLVEKHMGYWEGVIAMLLVMRLGPFVLEHNLGVVNGPDGLMRPDSGNIRVPDVTFAARGRAPTEYEAAPRLSPDLVVEVLSPSNTRREIERKLKEFFAGGTRLAWVIDPRTRTVAVHRGDVGPATEVPANGTLDGEDVVPGFAVTVAELFAGVPEQPA